MWSPYFSVRWPSTRPPSSVSNLEIIPVVFTFITRLKLFFNVFSNWIILLINFIFNYYQVVILINPTTTSPSLFNWLTSSAGKICGWWWSVVSPTSSLYSSSTWPSPSSILSFSNHLLALTINVVTTGLVLYYAKEIKIFGSHQNILIIIFI